MIYQTNSVGVTETYDPSFDYSWMDNLKPVNIIITKSLTDKMIDALMTEDCMKSCILHLTVTGWGGTIMEPGVGGYLWSKYQFMKLLNKGFPSNRVILRLDPIIPVPSGIDKAKLVLDSFNDTPINRVRVSILDQYTHVRDRMMTELDVQLPYDGFHAPKENIDAVNELLKLYKPRYDFVSCAEPLLTEARKVGCVSQEDIDLIPNSGVTLVGSSRQRNTCLCPSNKVNIMKVKPSRCPHRCVYCYWK